VKWFLHSLESCDMLQRTHDGQVTVHLSFNTVRRDRYGTTILGEKNDDFFYITGFLLKVFPVYVFSLHDLKRVFL
jgi:hypothetical protein